MLTLIWAELVKFKRSPILWGMGCLVLVHFIWNFSLVHSQRVPWPVFLNATYMDLWLRPAFFTSLAAYVVGRDRQHQSLSAFLSTPHTRSAWYLAKLTVVAIMIALILSISFIVDLILGWFFMDLPLTPSVFQENLGEFTLNLLFYWALVPLGGWFGLFLRGFTACSLLGVAIPLFNLVWGAVFLSLSYHWLFMFNPWTLPHVLTYAPENLPYPDLWRSGMGVLLFWFFAFLWAGLFLFHRRDVRSGE